MNQHFYALWLQFSCQSAEASWLSLENGMNLKEVRKEYTSPWVETTDPLLRRSGLEYIQLRTEPTSTIYLSTYLTVIDCHLLSPKLYLMVNESVREVWSEDTEDV